MSLILHGCQKQSISVTVWSRSGSVSGSTEGSMQLDACHSLYSPGLLWGFPSLLVIPSKCAFLYPDFASVSSSGLSISKSGYSLDCGLSAHVKVFCTGSHTMHALPVLSEGPSLPVKTLYLVASAPTQASNDAPVWWAHILWQLVFNAFLLVNFPNEFSRRSS